MTMDDITDLIVDGENFGKVAASASIDDCIGAFRKDCLAVPTFTQGYKSISTSYTTIDLSNQLKEISRAKSAMLVMLLYPQVSYPVDIKTYDPNVPEGYAVTTYETNDVSNRGCPVSVCWIVTHENFQDAAKVQVKFTTTGSAGYLKWHLLRFYFYTGLSESQEGE